MIFRCRLDAFCVLGACMLGPVTAAAQPPLTLDEAVQAAVALSSESTVARAAVREAQERIPQARAAYLPSVDFAQTWQRGNQPVFVFGSLLAQRQFTDRDFALSQLNTPAPITNNRSAFSVEQLIFDGGRTRAEARSASLGAQIAREGERQVRLDGHTAQRFARPRCKRRRRRRSRPPKRTCARLKRAGMPAPAQKRTSCQCAFTLPMCARRRSTRMLLSASHERN